MILGVELWLRCSATHLHQLCFMQHRFVDRSHCSEKRSLIDSPMVDLFSAARDALIRMSKSQDKLVDTG
jgi:hypothetical protein